MFPRSLRSVTWLRIALAVLMLAVPVRSALAQPVDQPTTQLWIDAPVAGATIRNGAPVHVGGWGADLAGGGSAVEQVEVYLGGPRDGGGSLIGTATLGGARPDVALVYQNPALTNAGYDLRWLPTNLPAGPHTLFVYAQGRSGGWVVQTITVHVAADQPPRPSSSAGSPLNPPPSQVCPAIYPPPADCEIPPSAPPAPGHSCIMIYPPPPGCES